MAITKLRSTGTTTTKSANLSAHQHLNGQVVVARLTRSRATIAIANARHLPAASTNTALISLMSQLVNACALTPLVPTLTRSSTELVIQRMTSKTAAATARKMLAQAFRSELTCLNAAATAKRNRYALETSLRTQIGADAIAPLLQKPALVQRQISTPMIACANVTSGLTTVQIKSTLTGLASI